MATRKNKTEEIVETPKAKKAAKKPEPKLLLEEKLQLKVQERKVLSVYPGANLVHIKNEHGGDLYVSDENVSFTKDCLVRPGEIKEFKNPTNIIVGSYSRPLFTIKHFSE